MPPVHGGKRPLHAGTLPRSLPERPPLPGQLLHVRGNAAHESPYPHGPPVEKPLHPDQGLQPEKGFEGREFIRIAVRNKADNDALVRAMHEICSMRSN